ncbi:hypothetical protein [Photorhabdus asymbiotica]|uniref:hypothetical protein n=1 Tax=Photorhabdus asymbiotica TaxID=291112 RepID=UPI003DA77706
MVTDVAIYYLGREYFRAGIKEYIIPFILQVAALLAAFTHPSHIVIYAPGDSFTCRRAATRNLLGIYPILYFTIQSKLALPPIMLAAIFGE